MKIRKQILCCFLSIVAIFCFLSPAFAELETIDEKELAKTNASVTGVPVNDELVELKQDEINPENQQTGETVVAADSNFSPSASRFIEGKSLSLSIKGQETFQFFHSPANSNVTGGITSVTPR